MKHSMFAVLLVLAVAMVATGPALAADDAAAPPAPADEAAPTVEAAPEVEAACSTPAEATATALGIEPAWHCPFQAPHCFRDDHCDAYCGDPRFGVCGSNRCCLCSG